MKTKKHVSLLKDSIDNLHNSLAVTDMTVTRLSGDVRDAQRTADEAGNRLIWHTGVLIALVFVCAALFLWNCVSTIQIDRINARAVAHQTLPQVNQ